MPQHYGGLLAQIGRGLRMGGGVMNADIFAQQEQERMQQAQRAEQRKEALAQFIFQAAQGGMLPAEEAHKALQAVNPELAAQLPTGAFGPSAQTQQSQVKFAQEQQDRAGITRLAAGLGLPSGTPKDVVVKAYEATLPKATKADNALINLVGPDGRKVTLRRGDPRADTLLSQGFTEYERPAASTTVNVAAGETAFDKERGKRLAEAQANIMQAGELAAGTLPNLAQMSTLLGEGTRTGAAASATLPLRAFAQDLGVDLDSAAKALGVPLGDVVSQQDFDRLSKQVIIDGFAKFKGNLNSKEVDLAVNAFGNLGRSPAANVSAIAAGMASAQIAAEDGARAAQAQSSADVRTLSAERARRGTERFMQLKKQYEDRLKAGGPQAPSGTPDSHAAPPPAGVPPALWNEMTPEERAAWQK